MTKQIELAEAADLLIASYKGYRALPPLLVNKIPQFAQSYFLKSGILVIPGVNEKQDKLRAVDLWHSLGRRHNWQKFNTEIAQTRWLSYFAKYAYEVARVFHPHRPKIILGHSLGAGMAQILAHYYRCPAICFSTPAVKSRRGKHIRPARQVLNIQHKKDWLPLMLSDGPELRLVGKSHTIRPATNGRPHAIKTYAKTVRSDKTLPKRWPL